MSSSVSLTNSPFKGYSPSLLVTLGSLAIKAISFIPRHDTPARGDSPTPPTSRVLTYIDPHRPSYTIHTSSPTPSLSAVDDVHARKVALSLFLVFLTTQFAAALIVLSSGSTSTSEAAKGGETPKGHRASRRNSRSPRRTGDPPRRAPSRPTPNPNDNSEQEQSPGGGGQDPPDTGANVGSSQRNGHCVRSGHPEDPPDPDPSSSDVNDPSIPPRSFWKWAIIFFLMIIVLYFWPDMEEYITQDAVTVISEMWDGIKTWWRKEDNDVRRGWRFVKQGVVDGWRAFLGVTSPGPSVSHIAKVHMPSTTFSSFKALQTVRSRIESRTLGLLTTPSRLVSFATETCQALGIVNAAPTSSQVSTPVAKGAISTAHVEGNLRYALKVPAGVVIVVISIGLSFLVTAKDFMKDPEVAEIVEEEREFVERAVKDEEVLVMEEVDVKSSQENGDITAAQVEEEVVEVVEVEVKLGEDVAEIEEVVQDLSWVEGTTSEGTLVESEEADAKVTSLFEPSKGRDEAKLRDILRNYHGQDQVIVRPVLIGPSSTGRRSPFDLGKWRQNLRSIKEKCKGPKQGAKEVDEVFQVEERTPEGPQASGSGTGGWKLKRPQAPTPGHIIRKSYSSLKYVDYNSEEETSVDWTWGQLMKAIGSDRRQAKVIKGQNVMRMEDKKGKGKVIEVNDMMKNEGASKQGEAIPTKQVGFRQPDSPTTPPRTISNKKRLPFSPTANSSPNRAGRESFAKFFKFDFAKRCRFSKKSAGTDRDDKAGSEDPVVLQEAWKSRVGVARAVKAKLVAGSRRWKGKGKARLVDEVDIDGLLTREINAGVQVFKEKNGMLMENIEEGKDLGFSGEGEYVVVEKVQGGLAVDTVQESMVAREVPQEIAKEEVPSLTAAPSVPALGGKSRDDLWLEAVRKHSPLEISLNKPLQLPPLTFGPRRSPTLSPRVDVYQSIEIAPLVVRSSPQAALIDEYKSIDIVPSTPPLPPTRVDEYKSIEVVPTSLHSPTRPARIDEYRSFEIVPPVSPPSSFVDELINRSNLRSFLEEKASVVSSAIIVPSSHLEQVRRLFADMTAKVEKEDALVPKARKQKVEVARSIQRGSFTSPQSFPDNQDLGVVVTNNPGSTPHPETEVDDIAECPRSRPISRRRSRKPESLRKIALNNALVKSLEGKFGTADGLDLDLDLEHDQEEILEDPFLIFYGEHVEEKKSKADDLNVINPEGPVDGDGNLAEQADELDEEAKSEVMEVVPAPHNTSAQSAMKEHDYSEVDELFSNWSILSLLDETRSRIFASTNAPPPSPASSVGNHSCSDSAAFEVPSHVPGEVDGQDAEGYFQEEEAIVQADDSSEVESSKPSSFFNDLSVSALLNETFPPLPPSSAVNVNLVVDVSDNADLESEKVVRDGEMVGNVVQSGMSGREEEVEKIEVVMKEVEEIVEHSNPVVENSHIEEERSKGSSASSVGAGSTSSHADKSNRSDVDILLDQWDFIGYLEDTKTRLLASSPRQTSTSSIHASNMDSSTEEVPSSRISGVAMDKPQVEDEVVIEEQAEQKIMDVHDEVEVTEEVELEDVINDIQDSPSTVSSPAKQTSARSEVDALVNDSSLVQFLNETRSRLFVVHSTPLGPSDRASSSTSSVAVLEDLNASQERVQMASRTSISLSSLPPLPPSSATPTKPAPKSTTQPSPAAITSEEDKYAKLRGRLAIPGFIPTSPELGRAKNDLREAPERKNAPVEKFRLPKTKLRRVQLSPRKSCNDNNRRGSGADVFGVALRKVNRENGVDVFKGRASVIPADVSLGKKDLNLHENRSSQGSVKRVSPVKPKSSPTARHKEKVVQPALVKNNDFARDSPKKPSNINAPIPKPGPSAATLWKQREKQALSCSTAPDRAGGVGVYSAKTLKPTQISPRKSGKENVMRGDVFGVALRKVDKVEEVARSGGDVGKGRVALAEVNLRKTNANLESRESVQKAPAPKPGSSVAAIWKLREQQAQGGDGVRNSVTSGSSSRVRDFWSKK